MLRAELISSGDIDISARGQADVEVQNNVETYGAATVATGDSIVDVEPVNEVLFGTGSSIRAGGDVNVSAGTKH